MTKRLKRVVIRLLVVLFSLLAPQILYAKDVMTCELAEQLAKAGEFKSALAVYGALLKATPDLDCARSGLDETRTRRLAAEAEWQRGHDLLLSGQREAAHEALLEALKNDPSRDDVRQRLESMLGDTENGAKEKDAAQTKDVYGVANALFAAGYESEAREAARKALQSNPEQPIPLNLQAPKPTKFEQLDTGASRIWKAIGTVGGGALAVIALLVMWGLVLRMFWRWMTRTQPCQVTIEKFDNPTTALTVGPDLRDRLANELVHARLPAASIKVVSTPGANPIPLAEETLPEQIKFVGPLLKWIRTPKRYSIGGVIHAPLGGEAALSVTIHNHLGELKARSTLTNRIVGDEEAAAYLDLGTRAGAWALFELDKIQSPNRRNAFTILGTMEWLSYGLFRCGERASSEGERSDAAMNLFHKALAADHNNIGALIVIGDDQARKCGDAVEMEKGITHLKLARELLGESDPRRGIFRAIDDTRIDPLWFQATYALAVAYVHRAAQQESHGERDDKVLEDLRLGMAAATELAVAIGATQRTLHSWTRKHSLQANTRRSLKAMLRRDTYYLLGVLAGAKASVEWLEEKELQERGERAPPPADSDEKLWMWLHCLDSKKLPCARDLVAPLESCLNKVGWAAHYNLACFHARARETDESFKYLQQYFEHLKDPVRKVRARWARKDPTLEPTRAQKKKEFDDLLPPDEPAEARPPAPSAPQREWLVEHCATP